MYLRNDLTAGLNKKTYPIRSFAGIDALTDEGTLPLTYCRYGYNVAFKNGTLVSGVGINNAKINGITLPGSPESGRRIIDSWVYLRYDYENREKDYRLMVALSNGRIYQKPLYGTEEFSYTGIYWGEGKAVGMNYKLEGDDVFVVFLETGGLYVYDGDVASYYVGGPWVNSACQHYGKIYATQYLKNRVIFTTPENVLDLEFTPNRSGYIEFSGEGGTVRKVISFNDHLFIFRDKAIHRLTAYTDFTEFRLIDVYSTNNRIFTDTVCICNNRLMFLAEDGLYSFDGYIVRKIYSHVTELIGSETNAVACWYDHKYYLAVKLKTDGETVGGELPASANNGMIIFDFDLDNISIFRGADICSFNPVSDENVSELLVAFRTAFTGLGAIDDSGNLFGQPLKKKWQSPMTELSALDRDKILRKVFLSTVYPLRLTVDGGEVAEIEISPSMRIQMLPVNKKAEKIRLTIETESDTFYLSSMLLEFDLVKRRYS